jgi:WD40 repeat protein
VVDSDCSSTDVCWETCAVITATITTSVRRATTILVSQTTVLVHQTTTIFQQVRLRTTTSRQVKAPPKRRRRRALIITVLSLALAIGGTTAGILLSNQQPAGPSAFYGAVSPNGEFIASAQDYDVYIWNAASGKVTTTLSLDGPVRDIAFSPDGQTIAVSTQGSVAIWDIGTGKIKEYIPTQYPYGIAYSPDGETLAVSDYQSLVLWDVSSNRATATFTPAIKGSEYVEALWTAFSPNGKTVAVSYTTDNPAQPVVELWDVRIRHAVAFIASVPTGDGSGGVVAFSRDGRTLVVSDRATRFYLWNISGKPALRAMLTGTMSSNDNKNTLSEGSTTYSPDGRTLATAGWPNDGASIWDAATGKQIAKLTAPDSSRVDALAYMPNGKTLVTFNDDERIYLWNIATRSITSTLTDPS